MSGSRVWLRCKVKDLVYFFQAMSDKTRQKILLLLEEKEYCVGELVKQFQLSQPTISRHLAVLKQAGLVKDYRCGQKVYYQLDSNWMKKCCAEYFKQFKCCQSLLQAPESEKSSLVKTNPTLGEVN